MMIITTATTTANATGILLNIFSQPQPKFVTKHSSNGICIEIRVSAGALPEPAGRAYNVPRLPSYNGKYKAK